MKVVSKKHDYFCVGDHLPPRFAWQLHYILGHRKTIGGVHGARGLGKTCEINRKTFVNQSTWSYLKSLGNRFFWDNLFLKCMTHAWLTLDFRDFRLEANIEVAHDPRHDGDRLWGILARLWDGSHGFWYSDQSGSAFGYCMTDSWYLDFCPAGTFQSSFLVSNLSERDRYSKMILNSGLWREIPYLNAGKDPTAKYHQKLEKPCVEELL